jgi:hypothetical protein
VEGHCAAWTSHASRIAVTRLGVGERKRRRKGKKIKGREEKEEKKRRKIEK